MDIVRFLHFKGRYFIYFSESLKTHTPGDFNFEINKAIM